MPVISDLSISSVTYVGQTLTCTGVAFGINQYAVSNIETSPTGAGIWTAVSSIDSWGDSQAVGTTVLGNGIFDVRITNSDNEQVISIGAFSNGSILVSNDILLGLTTKVGLRVAVGF